MANFSSFFPVAGGGGGFTKMNKYSTFRATDDATHKQAPNFSSGSQGQLRVNVAVSAGATSIEFDRSVAIDSTTNNFTNNTNSMAGYVFLRYDNINGGNITHTITTNAAFTDASDFTLNFSPAIAAGDSIGTGNLTLTPPGITINPATDLGLEDGTSIGYFMVGGGFSAYLSDSNFNTGMPGGNILQGTAIISNASTDLILTPGFGGNRSTPTESIITGGLTLTTADGSNIAGFGAQLGRNGSYYRGYSSAGTGIMGYGVGGATSGGSGASATADSHGWGSGGLRGGSNSQNNQAGDGAILLFY